MKYPLLMEAVKNYNRHVKENSQPGKGNWLNRVGGYLECLDDFEIPYQVFYNQDHSIGLITIRSDVYHFN